jgi:putative DNA primase/helicase
MGSVDVGSHLLRIAVGGQNLGKAKNKRLTWDRLIARLAEPSVDKVHTMKAYLAAPVETQLRLKNVGWFVGGPSETGQRNARSITERHLICLDIDDCTPAQIDLLREGFSAVCDYEFFAHTTRKHTKRKPRWRVVFPLAQPVPPDVFAAASRVLASHAFRTVEESMEAVDDVSFRIAQVMYWPSVNRDADFETTHNKGALLDAEKLLEDSGLEWRDFTNLPYSESRGQKRPVDPGRKAENPLEKRGVIGAFCRAYDVPAAIDAFLPEVYTPGDDHSGKPRYTYVEGSSANGAVVEDDGLFLYSHHGTDPCSEKLVNAFDMVRLHKFGHLDSRKEDEDKGPTKLPSFKAMTEFAMEQDGVRRELQAERYDMAAMFDDLPEEDRDTDSGVAADDFEDLIGGDEPAPVKWTDTLDILPNGEIKPSLTNIKIIIQHDPRMKGRIGYNKLASEPMIRRQIRSKSIELPAITVRDDRNGDLWTSHHDALVRLILESPRGEKKAGYGLAVSDRNMTDAVNMVSLSQPYHPVQDYVRSTPWDGRERVETLFRDYLGCEDNVYTRSVSRLTLVAAVTRAFEPGHKWDFVPILEGVQGKRKSTFIAILSRNWFSTLEGSFHDRKRLVEIMKGKWIIEIPELSGFSKSEVQDMKAFFSDETDRIREAYGKRAQEFPRQCIFIGSTNDKEYLRDATGNRRYWPIECHVDQIDTGKLAIEIDQIWAEAYAIYRAMRKAQRGGTLPLYLEDPEAQEIAADLQESRRAESASDGLHEPVSEWLDKPVSLAVLNGQEMDFGDEDDLVTRNEVTLMQVWVGAFGGRLDNCETVQKNKLSTVMRSMPGWSFDKSTTRKGKKVRIYRRDGTTTKFTPVF